MVEGRVLRINIIKKLGLAYFNNPSVADNFNILTRDLQCDDPLLEGKWGVEEFPAHRLETMRDAMDTEGRFSD